ERSDRRSRTCPDWRARRPERRPRGQAKRQPLLHWQLPDGGSVRRTSTSCPTPCLGVRLSPVSGRSGAGRERALGAPDGMTIGQSSLLMGRHYLTSYFMTSMVLAMPTGPKSPQPSPLGLIVLWQLWSEPTHVYRMQKLFE